MTNSFRVLVQNKLNSIEDLEAGEIIGDDMIEEGSYYFGYRVSVSRVANNLDYSDYRNMISLTGYLSTKGGSLSKFDWFADQITDKLSELRIRCTTTDITTLDTKVRKVLVTGTVFYNNLDNLLKS